MQQIIHNPFTLAQRYVGTPYVAGQFDCADLAAQVQLEVFGRAVALPVHRERPAGTRGQARELLALRGAIADPIDAAADGCAVLLWEREKAPTLPTACGSLPPEGAVSAGGGPAPKHGPAELDLRTWHVGTVFLHVGEIWVLHNSAKLQGAALHRLADLQRWGMRLDGYYAWRCAA